MDPSLTADASGQARGVSPAPKPAAVTEFIVVPPGPINKHKRHILAKFVQAHPGLAVTPNPAWKLSVDKAAERSSGGRGRGPKPPNPTPPLVLERANASGEVLQKGVPEGAGGLQVGINPSSKQNTQRTGSTYYLFVKTGKEMLTAYPVDMIYTFKPPPKRGTMSLEDAEARMRADKAAAESIGNIKMVPKSVAASANKRLEEEAAADPSKAKGLTMDQMLSQMMADDGGEDGLGLATTGKKGRKPPAGPGATKRKAKALQAADGTALDVDELVEDIYEGLGGEGGDLRPTKPEPAEDWEHEEQRDDDDLSQGNASSEDLEDDPGMRKKLGLAGDSEEEEEEDEAAKKLKQRLEEEDEEGAEGEQGEQEQAAVDTTTADVSMGDEDEDLDLDEMASTQLNVPKTDAGGTAKRKQPDNVAGADAGAKRARVSAPAAAPAAQRPVSPAPSTIKPAPAPAPRASSGGAASGPAAATGIPSPAEIRAAVQAAGGTMTSNMLRQAFSSRLRGPNLEALIKGFKDNMKVVLKPGAKAPDGSIQFVLK